MSLMPVCMSWKTMWKGEDIGNLEILKCCLARGPDGTVSANGVAQAMEDSAGSRKGVAFADVAVVIVDDSRLRG